MDKDNSGGGHDMCQSTIPSKSLEMMIKLPIMAVRVACIQIRKQYLSSNLY
jgi:hypothetical protein